MQSQSPRPGVRRNMNSRRRGLGKLPKVLALLGCALLLAVFFWNGDDAPAPGSDAAETSVDTGVGSDRASTPPDSLASTDLPGLLGPVARNPPKPIVETTPPPTPARETTPEPKPAEVTPPPPPPAPDPEVAQAARDLIEAAPAPARFRSDADAATLYNRGDRLIAEGDPVAGRALLSRLLFADNIQLSDADADAVRARLDEVNRRLFWSPEFVSNDTITKPYPVNNQYLSRIGVAHRVPYQLLETINRLDDPGVERAPDDLDRLVGAEAAGVEA
ncbi:MAG: hypothetical protein AAFX76_12000, partial [Planctomycetota bacterium]